MGPHAPSAPSGPSGLSLGGSRLGPNISVHGLVGPVIGAVRPTGDGSGSVCLSVLLEVDNPAFIEYVKKGGIPRTYSDTGILYG